MTRLIKCALASVITLLSGCVVLPPHSSYHAAPPRYAPAPYYAPAPVPYYAPAPRMAPPPRPGFPYGGSHHHDRRW